MKFYDRLLFSCLLLGEQSKPAAGLYFPPIFCWIHAVILAHPYVPSST